ncbi:MAG: protein-tyrosine sulfotransferase [Bacteroidia bacterium]|jgi:protein-tyrosine sulfotransferase
MKKLEYGKILGKVSDVLPRRYPLVTDQQDFISPLMIIGSGRNGSTMLGSMLNMHPDILLTPEQFAIVYSIHRFKLLNFLEWEDIVKIVVGEFARQDATLWDTNFANVYDKLYSLETDQRSLASILDHIYKEYGRSRGKEFKIWGDKTPKNTINLKLIQPIFPTAKYLFLIRDGRDVISSYDKAYAKNGKAPFHPVAGIENWNLSIENYQWIKEQVPEENLQVVRYEDLVTQPELTLSKVTQFIGLDFHESMLQFQGEVNRMGVSRMSHHENVAKEVNDSSVGKWKTRLTAQQQNDWFPQINKNLEEWGYE